MRGELGFSVLCLDWRPRAPGVRQTGSDADEHPEAVDSGRGLSWAHRRDESTEGAEKKRNRPWGPQRPHGLPQPGCTSRPSQLDLGSSCLPLLPVLLLVTTGQDWSLAVLQGPCLTPEDSLPHSLWGCKDTRKSKGKCRTQKLMSADGRKEKAPGNWARAGGFGVQEQVGPVSPHLHKSQCLTWAHLETQGLSRKTSRGDRGKTSSQRDCSDSGILCFSPW